MFVDLLRVDQFRADRISARRDSRSNESMGVGLILSDGDALLMICARARRYSLWVPCQRPFNPLFPGFAVV
jgi:hypothetical protein